MKGSFLRIEFSDISGSSSPDRNWAIRANEKGGGATGEAFFIEDLTADTTPFYIKGDAPSNALYVAQNGFVGLGTSLPSSKLHMSDFGGASITYEATAFAQKWQTIGDASFFSVVNSSASQAPFGISSFAPTGALYLGDGGDVGMGTISPQAPLELSSDETFNFFRISATGATVNDSVDIVFTEGPLGTGQLRYNIVEGTGAQTPEMTLDADGNMTLTGTLTTMGPTCAAGCDRVFDVDYPLPSISAHSDQMFAAGHLPSIGATVPNAPVNLSERQGNIINALEHAHLYINELHLRSQADAQLISELRAEADQTKATLAALTARLDVLDAK